MGFISSQGITVQFGTGGSGFSLDATSISWSGASINEIDITSMSSTVLQDSQNTNKKFVARAIDFAVKDYGTITVEYLGPALSNTWLGATRSLVFGGNTHAGNFGSWTATVEGLSAEASAGELVKGTVVFRL
jgi:hypothetical protein